MCSVPYTSIHLQVFLLENHGFETGRQNTRKLQKWSQLAHANGFAIMYDQGMHNVSTVFCSCLVLAASINDSILGQLDSSVGSVLGFWLANTSAVQVLFPLAKILIIDKTIKLFLQRYVSMV